MPSTEVITSTSEFYQKRFWKASDGFVFADDLTKFATVVNSVNILRGDKLPDWRRLISTGQNATTILTVTEEKCFCEPTFVESRRTYLSQPLYVDYNVSGNLLNLGFNPDVEYDSILGSASNRSLSNFYSRLSAVETKFKGLVFSGELKESLEMIRHPARALRRGLSSYLDSLKKGGRMKRSKRRSFVRDTWLEYSFGWAPLISDLDSAIQAFYLSKAVHPIFEMVRGRGMVVLTSSQGTNNLSVGYGKIQYQILDEKRAECRHYGVYHSSGNGISDSHSYGFTPSEFIPTLWELMPYSFLVDYFTNVGKILESWSYRTNRLAFLSQGTLVESNRKASNIKLIPDPDDLPFGYKIRYSGSSGSYSTTRRSMVRLPNASHDRVTFELKVPGKWYQWINIAALSKQLSGVRKILNS